MPREASDRQLAVLRAIVEAWATNGHSPTIRELCTQMNISALRGITVHLDALQRRNYLVRTPQARSITVTPEGRKALGLPPDPAEQLRILRDAVKAYQCQRREYERLSGEPELREIRRAMEPDLRSAREQMFRLLEPDPGKE